ncbi:MAG: hypothetical protein JWN74_2188 [Acidobacteriaceae bacterium]|nr:hypothetical protein [Acidobacteriaceae bacterium]
MKLFKRSPSRLRQSWPVQEGSTTGGHVFVNVIGLFCLLHIPPPRPVGRRSLVRLIESQQEALWQTLPVPHQTNQRHPTVRLIAPTLIASLVKSCEKCRRLFGCVNQFQGNQAKPCNTKKKEHWMTLCQRAAVEQDPERLLHLIAEITRMLDEKEDRLRREQSDGTRDLCFSFSGFS